MNNIYNITNNPATICNLNQLDLLNQIEKIPTYAYWFLIIAILILTLWLFIPKLREKIYLETIIFPVYMLLICTAWLYTFFTFNITQEYYNLYIEPKLWIGFTIIILIILYKERNKIKEIINNYQKEN